MHGLERRGSRRKDFTDNSLQIVWTFSTSFFPGSGSILGSIVTADRMSSKDDNPSLRKQPALLAPRHKRLDVSQKRGEMAVFAGYPLLPKHESSLESGDECQIH